MSDDGFTDWEEEDETHEETPSVEVETDSSPHFALARLDALLNEAGQLSFGAGQVRHGDVRLNPAAYGRFNGDNGLMDHDAMHKWMAQEESEQPEDKAEQPDIQGWTYIADYSLHPLTPNHSGPFRYYIHARIRWDNRLEFGVFESVHQGNSEWLTALAKINLIQGQQGLEDARFTSSQVLHGDLRPPLRIASKAEAEQMMLKGGKLIMAACPRSIGVLMNTGQAKIRLRYGENTSYRLLVYYGHIWTYWATIIDNTLYMVGLPLYTGSDRGSYAYSLGESAGRVSVPLPPTLHDLRSDFVGNTNTPSHNGFHYAVEMLWGIEPYSGLASVNHSVTALLEEYGDYESSVVLCRRAIAKLTAPSPGQFVQEQVLHGDIDSGLTLYSTEGGVYADSNGLTICEGEQVNNELTDHGTQYSWGQSSGASGFIRTTTRCTVEGRVRYTAQAFYVANYGPSYLIRLTTPFHPYGYIPESGDEGYKLLSHSEVTITIPKEPEEDPEDDNPPGGGGGGGGGSGGGGDGGDTPGGGGSEDIGDCGIWLESSEDARISREREDTADKVGYRYKITIRKSFSVSEKLHYLLKASFSVHDGNSYSVGDGASVTMWYYLQGGIATIRVCNLTSSSWNGREWVQNSHPDSVTSWEQTALRPATARGEFPVREITSRTSVASCNQSNIVKLVPTGRIRKFNASLAYIGADGRKHRKRVHGTMTCYKLVLQERTIRQILKNRLRNKTATAACTISPKSIKGTASGSAGAPTVTNNGISAQAVPLPIQGETSVKGSYPMKISGKLDKFTATYNVINGTTSWFEESPGNRHSASISGTFKVSSPASQF